MALAQEINRLTGLGGEPSLKRLLGADGEPLERSDNGQFALPHPITFTSLLNQFSKTYSWRWDEAYKDNRNNALAMRRDAWLMALLRERQMPTAQMSWHLEPDDGKSPDQKACCDYLTKLIEKTPNMQRFKMGLLEALWYGRYGVQIAWHWAQFNGRRTLLAKDHRPVNGDKIQFRYRLRDDGPEVEEGAPAVLVHSAWATRLPAAETVLTDTGRALLLQDPYWRERFVIHKHEVDDADYLEGEMAGAVHGVGIRSRIYWVDWLRREFLSWVSDYMERVGQGMTIFYYEAGNPASEKEAIEAAKKYGRNTVVVWPRPIGSEKQGAGIERMEVNTSGSQFLVDLIKYFDEIERYYIVGQTLSSGDGPTGLGSGLAEAHMDTKFRIVKFDCTNLEETLTTDFVDVLKRWNAPQAAFNVRWKFDIDRPNPKDRLDAAKSVWDMGAKLDEAEVRSFAGLSTPKEGDPVLEQQQQQPGPGGPGGMPGGPGGPGGNLNDQLKAMAHGNGQQPGQNGDQSNGNGDGGNGPPTNGKPAGGLGGRLAGLRNGAAKHFAKDAHGLEHKGPGPGGGQFTGDGGGEGAEHAEPKPPGSHRVGDTIRASTEEIATELVKHLADELNGHPRKFASTYSDLEDEDKKAVTAELKDRGLLHVIDARKRKLMTASELIESVRGRLRGLKDEHAGNRDNRGVPFEESEAYKAITGADGGDVEGEVDKPTPAPAPTAKDIQAKTHKVGDVISGKYPVGVVSSKQDMDKAREAGLYTTKIKGVDIYAQNEEAAQPLIDYLEAGGDYGTTEFSKLLGYSSEEIDQYHDFLRSTDQEHLIAEPKPKPERRPVHDPEHVKAHIQKAIEERAGRATHGNTGTNSFFIYDDGTVLPWDSPERRGKAGGHMVHSHSSENWKEWSQKAGRSEDFQPHNGEDVSILLRGMKEGDKTASTVIMADGRMETLRLSPDATPEQKKALASLSKAKIKKQLDLNYDDAKKRGEEIGTKYRHEVDRDSLKKFADKYGLEYTEGRWKGEDPELPPGDEDEEEDETPPAPPDPLAGTRQQTMFQRGGLNGELLRFAKKDAGGRWITIGATGPEDDRHGGSPVYVGSGGEILKGHPGLTGQKLGSIGEKAKPQPPAPKPDAGPAPVDEGEGGRKKVTVGKKKPVQKEGAQEQKKALAADKEYKRAVWSKKARKEKINPEHLHSLAQHLIEEEDAHTNMMQSILDKTRSMSLQAGYGDIRGIGQLIARGKVEDPDQVKGLDDMAKTLQASYPEILGEEGEAERKLFDILAHGNFKPDAYNRVNIERQQEDRVYAQAFDYLIERREQEKQRQAEELAAVPFARGGLAGALQRFARNYAKDAQGHEHKGSGPGGGQFTSTGGGGEAASETSHEDDEPPTEATTAAPAQDQTGLTTLQEDYAQNARRLAKSPSVARRVETLKEKMREHDERWQKTVDGITKIELKTEKLHKAHHTEVAKLNKMLDRHPLFPIPMTQEEHDQALKCDAAWAAHSDHVANVTAKCWQEIAKATKRAGPVSKKIELKSSGESPFHTSDANKVAERLTGVISKSLEGTIDDVTVRASPPEKGSRAYFGGTRHGYADQSIYMPVFSSDSVVAHELGHGLETHLDIRNAAITFLQHRVGDEPLQHMGTGYEEYEMGRENDFRKLFGDSARYVGKHYYNNNDTEITSMGLQEMYSNPRQFAAKDPEYFKFILGVLDGTFTKDLS